MRGDPYSRCAGLPPEVEARARAMGCNAIPLQRHTHATHSSCDAVQILCRPKLRLSQAYALLFLSYTLPSQFYTKPARSKALPCHCTAMHFQSSTNLSHFITMHIISAALGFHAYAVYFQALALLYHYRT